MTNKKNKIYLGVALATLTMAGALVSPQASALNKAERMAEAANSKAEVLEAQLRLMQDEIASLRAQVSGAAPAGAVAADTQKVQELDAWMTSVKSEPVVKKVKDNMLYFRGGYTGNDEAMAATTNTVNGVGQMVNTTEGHSGGWNFGAGIDFSLNDDLFGLMDNTELLGELDLNYVDLGTFTSGITPTLVSSALPSSTASQSMLRINASPKIKFMKDSKLRPWIIPVGFTLNIISPPSQANTITELKPGMNFGTGVDYNIWKSLYVGADVRYFLATSSLDGTNVNGLTAGGSLGFGF
ncbi:porin family protein [Methylobacter sp. S3L5C]|uniref:porin family protein n=1 Tax=Methylobacter sp. S3L5C TaxID=2839024 RepID=UPI001FAD0D10|nr:porin family protein [Methylobacter sp. S3L5C]